MTTIKFWKEQATKFKKERNVARKEVKELNDRIHAILESTKATRALLHDYDDNYDDPYSCTDPDCKWYKRCYDD